MTVEPNPVPEHNKHIYEINNDYEMAKGNLPGRLDCRGMRRRPCPDRLYRGSVRFRYHWKLGLPRVGHLASDNHLGWCQERHDNHGSQQPRLRLLLLEHFV